MNPEKDTEVQTAADYFTKLSIWEKRIREYNRIVEVGGEVVESVKVATYQASICPEDLRDNLSLNADKFATYESMRTEVERILVTRTGSTTSQTAALGTQGPAPMDIGAMTPVKCDICEKPGHIRSQCWYKGGKGGAQLRTFFFVLRFKPIRPLNSGHFFFVLRFQPIKPLNSGHFFFVLRFQPQIGSSRNNPF